MAAPIFYIDTSEVREGHLEELKTAMQGLAEFVDSNEPRLLGYNVYFNRDGTRMTVVHVHPDSASLEYHMKVACRLFPKYAHLVRLVTIDVYGEPTDAVIFDLDGVLIDSESAWDEVRRVGESFGGTVMEGERD